MSCWRCLAVVLLLTLAAGGQRPAPPHDTHGAEFRAMEQKLAYLKQNAAKAHPDPKPTELTEAEANAYFAEGGVKLPKGVSQVHLASRPGVLDAHGKIDFEEIMQGCGSNNPLYAMFSGKHDVEVVAQASGANGTGSIQVQSIQLDSSEVPRWALEFFAQHYITPKYPNVGMTTTFKLPLRIESAVVDAGKARLVQR
ncbi:MAG: hypothetical protein ABSD98_04590 [Candidatus Korobacteraceae bacterium]|jgi:hypothetical protein